MKRLGTKLMRATAGLLCLLPGALPAAAAMPGNVVSLNVCTDQMAMLIAADGQLLSVSDLATDPTVSALAKQAERYRMNHGLAEEVYLMQPGLVLAGTYSTAATVSLLRRLGIAVEEFSLASSFDEVRADFRRMGKLLGREQRAEDLIAELDDGLVRLSRNPVPRETVALYYANGYTAGTGTLVNAAVEAAGLDNLGARLGLSGTARLPLEELVLANPDLVTKGERQYETPALAEQNFAHPAFQALAGASHAVSLPSVYTVCGGPFTLEAIRILQQAALSRKGVGQ